MSERPWGPPPLAPRHWPAWAGAGLYLLVGKLPHRVRLALASTLAAASVRLDNRHRRTAAINLAACFPDDDVRTRRRRLRHYFRSFWQTVLIQPRLWSATPESIGRLTRYHGREHVDRAIGAGRPVVLLITHTVALDHGIIGLATHYRMHGIYKPFENPVLDWLVLRSRARFGGTPTSRGNRFRTMIRLLREGRLLCYLSDEDFGAKGSVFAPFFGRRKATLAMLPRLVDMTPGTAVLPMASYYDARADRIDVRLWPPLEGYPGTTELESAAIMNRAIEKTVRHAPEQFLWKLRIFRTDPEGGASRYARVERGELSIEEL